MLISLFLQTAANAASVVAVPASEAARPAWLDNVIYLWPLWVVIAAGVALVYGYRVYEKAGIYKTNAANIDALDKLLTTRTKELAEAEETIEDRDATIDDLQGQCEVLESEYKTLAGLVLSELLSWFAQYEKHRIEMAQKDSDLRIANARISFLEQREAEHSAIHRSE